MLVKATVQKVDNGFKGMLVDWEDDIVIGLGLNLFNRHFKAYYKGTKFEVLFNVTPTGRRVVKKILRVIEEEGEGMASLADATVTLKVSGGTTHVAKTVWMAEPEEVISSDEVIKAAIFGTSKEEKVVRGSVETEAAERVAAKRTARKREIERSVVDGYYISHEARLIFNTAHKLSETRPERAVKVMMVGASGYGKTTLPKLFAELTGKRFLRMNCATIRDPEEWFGYREAREGSTLFIRSQFGREIEEGNLVVVLDEFNRLEPWLHNTLFPLLDDDGATVVHDEEFRIGPGVIVVGTINTGYKYTGTFELDEALFNRFDFTLEVGPMPHAEEVKVLTKRTGIGKDEAAPIVKMSNILRQNDVVCSTRTSLLVAQMVVAGMKLREAFESAVVRRIPGDNASNGLRKQVVDLINVQLGPFEPRELEQDVFAPEKKVQVQEEVKVAPKEESDKEPVLTLRHDKSKELLFINTVGLLRKLPIKLPSDLTLKDGTPKLAAAHSFADMIRQGEEVRLTLNHRPDDLPNIIEALRGAGLTGSFKAAA